MGCTSSKSDKKPTVNKDKQELDRLVEMPLHNKEDDYDLVSLVELSVKCGGLPRAGGRSNPMAVLYIQEGRQYIIRDQWVMKGRTEVIHNTHEPSFIKTFTVSYSFERQLRVSDIQFKIDVYNVLENRDIEALQLHPLIGSAIFNIHEIVGSQTKSTTKELFTNDAKKSTITVISEEQQVTTHRVLLGFKILASKASGEQYIRLCRKAENSNEFVPVYSSESFTKVPISNPYSELQPIELSASHLCRGDHKKPIKIDLLLTRRGHSDITAGSAFCTLKELLQGQLSWEGMILNSNELIASINMHTFVYKEDSSFLDYIFGGCEISLLIGIDFTKSNGLPSESNSLHYYDQSAKNEYVQAIQAVGEVLQYYDSDNRIPVYGFGAKLPPDFQVISHCFALNGNIFDPEVQGIEGVLKVYEQTRSSVQFHGPTYFSQLLETAIQYASANEVNQQHQHYFILLILTDGIINDMEQTIDQIVRAGKLPLSIIIVGVGPEDFEMMHELDSDHKSLYSRTFQEEMKRDIVQFVPFSNYKHRPNELARQVLYEIPKQVTQFFQSISVVPNAPKNESFSRQQTLQFSHDWSQGRQMTNSSQLLYKTKMEFLQSLESEFDLEIAQEIVNLGIPCMDPHIIRLALQAKKDVKPSRSIIKPSQDQLRSSGIGRINSLRSQCRRCGIRPIQIRFLECGHMVICHECLSSISNACPECDQPIVRWVLTQLPRTDTNTQLTDIR